MRILSIILLTTTLLLAFKPGVDLILLQNLSEKSCCIDTCADTQQADTVPSEQEDNGCDGNFCNPFQVCGSCFLLCTNLTETGLQNVDLSTHHKFPYISTASALFITDFWQPPKLV
jgi:hypothetical protein